MWRKAQWILGGTLVAAVTASTPPHGAPLVSHEVIVVYVGVDGVDHVMAGLADTVRLAATRQFAGTGQHLILRGVSLDPEISTGLRDLAIVGTFDEISVGGNWTNSTVVRYLGGDFGHAYPKTGVPQVVVLERDVDDQITALHVGPEREIARYIGADKVWDWAKKGAPIPQR